MNISWALGILTCPRCRQQKLSLRPGGAECGACGCRLNEKDGIFDFLTDPHPVVRREQQAIAHSDAVDPGYIDHMQNLLRAVDRGEEIELNTEETEAFACITHIIERRQRIVELLGHVDHPPGSILLEFGSDHCWATGLFLDRGFKVIASDISDHLRFASRAGDPNLFRMNADMNRLPMPDESVDIVWGTSVAHHSWDLELTFEEAARVLRPGGSLVLCCEPMPSWLRYALFGFGLFFGRKERKEGINERLKPRSKWIASCRRAGLNPHLIHPSYTPDEIKAKLKNYRLPQSLCALVSPLIKLLQVSIHMVARKP